MFYFLRCLGGNQSLVIHSPSHENFRNPDSMFRFRLLAKHWLRLPIHIVIPKRDHSGPFGLGWTLLGDVVDGFRTVFEQKNEAIIYVLSLQPNEWQRTPPDALLPHPNIRRGQDLCLSVLLPRLPCANSTEYPSGSCAVIDRSQGSSCGGTWKITPLALSSSKNSSRLSAPIGGV